MLWDKYCFKLNIVLRKVYVKVISLLHKKPVKKAVKVSFYKTWTNNWKSTKPSGNTLEHLDKLQPKFQWHTLFHSWVIQVPRQPKEPVMVSFYKKWANNSKTTKLSGNIYEHLDKPQTKFQYPSLVPSWVVKNFIAMACFLLELLSFIFYDIILHDPRWIEKKIFWKSYIYEFWQILFQVLLSDFLEDSFKSCSKSVKKTKIGLL